jgi:cobaltochelatase CobS
MTETVHVQEPTIVKDEANDKLLFMKETMKDSLGYVTANEAKEIAQQEVLEFHGMRRIELVNPEKPAETKKLEEKDRHFLFTDVLTTINQNLPVALIGPAGSGKSTVCKDVADALDLRFFLQNGVTGSHELTGYMDAHGRYVTTPFRTAFEHGGLFNLDEVDTSEAGALKWINTALANGYAGFPDKSEPICRSDKFRIIIAANTYGTGADRLYVGANQIDASTLDRFVFIDFPYDEKLEMKLAGNIKWVTRVQSLRRAASKEKARMVISPRASIHGAKLLSVGWKQETVEARVIWKGIDLELKQRIQKAA